IVKRPADGQRPEALDAVVVADLPRIPWGRIALAMVLVVVVSFGLAIAFGVGIRLTGRHGWDDFLYLLYFWLVVAGLGGLLILIPVTLAMTRFFWARLAEPPAITRAEQRLRRGVALFGALLIGAGAACLVGVLSFYTMAFGALVGGIR